MPRHCALGLFWAAIFCAVLSPAAQAAVMEPHKQEPDETLRWSVELNAQLGSLLAPQPAMGAQLGYILPVFNDHLQLWGAYSPWTQILAGGNLRPDLFRLTRQHRANMQTLTLGGRWYLNRDDFFRASLLMGAGLEFTPGGQILTRIDGAPNPSDTTYTPVETKVPAQISAGVFLFGAGMDIYPVPNWSIGGDILLGTPAPVWLLRVQIRSGIHF